ncbi:MAG: hypothetical protein J6Y94_08550, partial [Bacteriovoracaceae bacterium]|nr:hypothetical protein [Bacteriovoracaceae bacterium]
MLIGKDKSKGYRFCLGLLCLIMGATSWANPCSSNLLPPKGDKDISRSSSKTPPKTTAKTKSKARAKDKAKAATSSPQLSAWNKKRLTKILRHVEGVKLTEVDPQAGQNLSILRRYRQAIVRDYDLRCRLWYAAWEYANNFDAATASPTSQEYAQWLREVLLQDVIPHLIKVVPISEEYPEGLIVEIDTNYLAVNDFFSDVLQTFGGDDVSDTLIGLLGSWERRQTFLKFDGKKFILANTKEGAILSDTILQVYHTQQAFRKALPLIKEGLPFFFQDEASLEVFFGKANSLEDLYTAWAKFEKLAAFLAKHADLANLILKKAMARDDELDFWGVIEFMTEYQLESLIAEDFYRRLPTIYNVLLHTIKERINLHLQKLQKEAGIAKDAQERFQLHEGDYVSRQLLNPLLRLFGSNYFAKIRTNVQDWRLTIPIYTKLITHTFTRQELPLWEKLANLPLPLPHPQDPTARDVYYMQQILKIIVHAFQENPSLAQLKLTIRDVNDVVRKNARQGKGGTAGSIGGTFQKDGATGGKINLDADTFCAGHITTLSVLIHELGHLASEKMDILIRDYKKTGKVYQDRFILSEVSARVRELNYLQKILDAFWAQIEQDPENIKLLQDIGFVLQRADHTITMGQELAARSRQTLDTLFEEAYLNDGENLRYALREYDERGTLVAQGNSATLTDWTVPAPDNNHHVTIEIGIPPQAV